MKLLLVLTFFLVSTFSMASAMMNCGPGHIRVWTQMYGYACVKSYQSAPTDCVSCQTGQQNLGPYQTNWFNTFPSAIYRPYAQPWWATQGNMYYPNMYYPGVWNNQGYNPGINPNYYHGQGGVFAAKPNVYIESIHQQKKFTFAFTSKEELSFLATTPVLDEQNTWKGKLVGKDRFQVEDIHYDYLFYDIRLPKEKMQFERGLCANREETINWMLNDLKDMKYPLIALQDFEEHWKVKIPDYPFFCIYPQYNQQLDAALPVSISLEHTYFTRSLYVLVPHRKEPDVDEPQVIPFPLLDSNEIRPKSLIKYENMFKEWGVAFLGE